MGGVLQRTPAPPGQVAIDRRRQGDGLLLLRKGPEAGPGGQHLPPVFGLPLVHPQHRVAHAHIVIRRPQIRRAAELSVPGVGELMRQKGPVVGAVRIVRKIAFAEPVLARAVMLQPLLERQVADREHEVVMVIVVRAEQPVGLPHQGAMCVELGGRRVEVARPVGKDVQEHRRDAAGIEVNPGGVLAGKDRAVHQRLDGRGLEADRRARRSRAVKGGGDRPARGRGEGCLDGNVADIVPRRIEHEAAPLEEGDGRRDLHRADVFIDRRKILKAHIQRGGVLRRLHVEGEGIGDVPLPVEPGSIAADLKTGELADRA